MNNKIAINIARVFVNNEGKFGNPVGIVLDEDQKLGDEERQKIATNLNFSETVFIDSLEEVPSISIFNPQHKVKFAGHAVLGTVFFIKNVLNKNISSIKCGDKLVKNNQENNITYITAPLSIMPNWNFEELSSVIEVESIFKKEHTFVWSWIDEAKGLVRARTFAPDWGIPEDQANGSGSMLLAAKLNRELEIHHGEGSIIFAKPVDINFAEVGGLVTIDKRSEFVFD